MLIATRRSILCYYVLLRDPTGKIWKGEGGGGTPIDKLYDYVPLWRGGFQAVEIIIVIKKEHNPR